MRRWACILTVLIGLSSLEACGPSSFYYNCHTADDINATTRSEVTTESLKFARAAFDGDAPQAFEQLTDEAKKNVSQEQLTNIFQGMKASGPYDSLRVERLMAVTGRGHMQQQTSVADCAKDTALTENNVRVVIANVPEQAYAMVSAKGSHENWFAILWLIPSSGKWQIQSFQVAMGTAAGKPVADILAMARQENSQGHTLNAGALYAAAASLAAYGPFYHTRLEDVIQKEAQQVSPPQEFRQRPPFNLPGPAGSFSIVRLSPIAINGKLYLVISQEVSPWKDSREIEQKNRSLIKTFASRFPEYQNAFAGLVAEATESGGTNGWRTVMENSAINGH
jgi:hypothetical protein